MIDWESTVYKEYWIVIPLLLQIIGSIFVVLIDPYIKKRDRWIMRLVILLEFSLIVQNVADYTLSEYIPMPRIRTIVVIYGYCVRPLIILLFCYIIGGNRNNKPFWVLLGVNAAVYLSALFSPLSFFISEDNRFSRGPLNYTCYIISAMLLLWLAYLTFREGNKERKSEQLIPALNLLMVIVSLLVELLIDRHLRAISYLTMAVLNSTLFYYIWLHLRFVSKHEQALMAEQRIQIMMTQIQPHFLYNTLSTIQALCRIDPEKAFEITERFGAYLRQNIDSLSQPNLIPITKELEHTQIYAEIESVRFDNITVLYHTPETNFAVPALTIQPLVENAIRHGVRIREEGVVSVSTAKTDAGYEIVIEDNGVGFDTALAAQSDDTHIGLRNVRERIETMCGGTVMIESAKNVGTKITITIPSQNVPSI